MTKKFGKIIVLLTLVFVVAILVFFCSTNQTIEQEEALAVKKAFQQADKNRVYIYLKKKDTILGHFGVLPPTSLKDTGVIKMLGCRIDWFMENDTIDYMNLKCPFNPDNMLGFGLTNNPIFFVEKFIFSDSSFVVCSRFDTVCWKKTSYIVDRRCIHKDSIPEKYIKINDEFWHNNLSKQQQIYYQMRPHLLKKDKGEKYGFGCVCKHKWKDFWE